VFTNRGVFRNLIEKCAMKPHYWLTGMQEFEVRFANYSPVRKESFNGTIGKAGATQQIAFSGLAEFYKAVARLRCHDDIWGDSHKANLCNISEPPCLSLSSAMTENMDSANDV
jgi:hypothetical protein